MRRGQRPKKCPKKAASLEEILNEQAKYENLKYDYEKDKLKYVSDYLVDYTFYEDHIDSEGNIYLTKVYIEVKGWLDSEDRAKYVKVRKNNPGIDLRFVFGKPHNKIKAGSKTTYAMWAEKNGFKWAEKVMPGEWVDRFVMSGDNR